MVHHIVDAIPRTTRSVIANQSSRAEMRSAVPFQCTLHETSHFHIAVRANSL
jgi:hypothetical protein